MPLSIAPQDSVVSTDLPALPPGVNAPPTALCHRGAQSHKAVRGSGRPYREVGVEVAPHHVTYLDALARDYPYFYTMAFYH